MDDCLEGVSGGGGGKTGMGGRLCTIFPFAMTLPCEYTMGCPFGMVPFAWRGLFPSISQTCSCCCTCWRHSCNRGSCSLELTELLKPLSVRLGIVCTASLSVVPGLGGT